MYVCRKAVELRERLKKHVGVSGRVSSAVPEGNTSSKEALKAAAMNTPLPKAKGKTVRNEKVTPVGPRRGQGRGRFGMLSSVVGWACVVIGVSLGLMFGVHVVCRRQVITWQGRLGEFQKVTCELSHAGVEGVRGGALRVLEHDVLAQMKDSITSAPLLGSMKHALIHFKNETVPLMRDILIKGVDDVQTMLMERRKKASEKALQRLNPAVLDTLIGMGRDDTDSVWASTMSFLEDIWARRKIASPNKANVVMFACTSMDACRLTEDELAAVAPPSSVLKLHILHSVESSVEKGEIQSRLASFLTEHPTGVVLIPHIERWSPLLISVLNNAIGEGGSLIENGEPVATTEATYLITVEVPKSLVENQDTPPHLTSAVKQYLMKKIVGDDITTADEMVQAISNSFRRRIDVVAASVLHI